MCLRFSLPDSFLAKFCTYLTELSLCSDCHFVFNSDIVWASICWGHSVS